MLVPNDGFAGLCAGGYGASMVHYSGIRLVQDAMYDCVMNNLTNHISIFGAYPLSHARASNLIDSSGDLRVCPSVKTLILSNSR